MEPLLQAAACSKDYRKGPLAVHALRGVDLTLHRGEFVGCVGRSGSGKSTLLNLIGGLDTPSSGQIRVQGRDLGRMTRNQLALHRRKTVGMIFQSFNLIPSRTALDNVVLALIFGGVRPGERKARARDLLGMVGLEGRTDHKPSELSGGEAQRVAIARALANEPRILLADEPTGNLDTRTSAEIMELLTGLNRQGLTVFMVTHDLELASRTCHRILHMLDGEIVNEEKTGRAFHAMG